MQLRNPWGVETFKGRWSDKSHLWTDDLLKQANHTLDNDGKHHMAFEDYIEQMQFTEFILNTHGMHLSGFVFEDDDKPHGRVELFGDGVSFNSHKISVKSPVDQIGYISVHTYNWKHYHGACSTVYFSNSESMVLYKKKELY